MVTPFDRKGNLDLKRTTRLVEYLIEHGSDSLLVAGTTGESATLSTEEKLALFAHVVKVAAGRVPVIAGTGTYDTHATVELTKKAEKTGINGILAVTPYYIKPNQEGMYRHFETIAKSTDLPVMLYNIPGRSVVNMNAETIIRLARIENITAVKEASGNLDQITEIIRETDDDFALYSGDDGLTLPIMAVGGTGVVSTSANIIGREMRQMILAYTRGEVTEAAAAHRRLLPLMRALFAAPSPAPVKTALQMMGMDVGGVRLPLVPLNEEERLALQRVLHTTIPSEQF
ncbi:MAG TPA: 4-hydroxy-tetrahydrodipicolinate synthase [Bacillales bacterium]|nr:4-hydroxy-tetrahydrodipicolinate synthase [Bacillales bacterium]